MTIIRHTYDDQMQKIVPLTALMLKQRERDAIGKSLLENLFAGSGGASGCSRAERGVSLM